MASKNCALFQCSSIAMTFVVPSFRVQVFESGPRRYQRTAWPDQAQPHSSLVEPTIHVSLNNGRVAL
jgi:hypothetical protein